MKVYFSIHSEKTASGLVSRGKEKSINEGTRLTEGGMIKVIPKILGKEVKAELTTRGIEIEEKDLEEIKQRLSNDFKDCNKVEKLLKIMKLDIKKMDEAIEKEDGKLNYDNSQEFFGYFFWTAPYYHLAAKQLKKVIKKCLPESTKEERNKFLLDLITMDTESYTFKIVEDFGKENAFKKHPFLKHLKGAQVSSLPKVKIKKQRNKRLEALEEIKKELTEEQFKEIKKWSDLINELQIILEIKNYYWPKLEELIFKKRSK